MGTARKPTDTSLGTPLWVSLVRFLFESRAQRTAREAREYEAYFARYKAQEQARAREQGYAQRRMGRD